jgi:hypothetical protein
MNTYIYIYMYIYTYMTESRWKERKGNETTLAEEHCRAITQAVGRSCSGRSGYSVLQFGFQQDFLAYTTCTWPYILVYLTLTGRTFRNATVAKVGKCLHLSRKVEHKRVEGYFMNNKLFNRLKHESSQSNSVPEICSAGSDDQSHLRCLMRWRVACVYDFLQGPELS